MTYSNDKLFTIPAAFTALNGCVQSFTLTAGTSLHVEPKLNEKGEVTNETEVKTAQANLLRVLELLRSNGAQPIITKVEGSVVDFTVEQAHVYGTRGPKHQIAKDESREANAKADIEAIFGEIKALVFNEEEKVFEAKGKKLLAGVTVHAPINALC